MLWQPKDDQRDLDALHKRAIQGIYKYDRWKERWAEHLPILVPE